MTERGDANRRSCACWLTAELEAEDFDAAGR